MNSRQPLRSTCNTRRQEINYQLLEPRKFLASLFPAYIDGQLTLGNAESAAPYALADTFELETNPGASKTIFLDFDGYFSSNNNWDHTINFPSWNRDGSSGNFSNSELIEIQTQFQNVAEDFAPFDVNVTTKDPGLAALTKSSFFDQNFGVRVVSTQATSGFGNGIGGVAYLRSFDDSIDNPVFVFNKGTNNGAMTISHEVGHALGLTHDGLNGREYHPGSGSGETSWGPILGAPFNRNISQWSNGDYAGSTQTQDDLAIITNSQNGINYKADDVGNNIASASILESDGNQVFDWGIIERSSDVDYYQFTTSGGVVDLDFNAFGENPNLDIRMRLYDSGGNWVLSNNHADRVDALINRTLAIAIDGVGKSGAYSDYGSLGFYSIEGTIPGTSASQKIGEVGNIPDLYHAWKTVQLSQSYVNPVVVAGPATTNGADVVTVRIRNVTSNSFQIRIDEWDYRDGRHSFERVDYMVVEAGTHQLTDGTVLHASKINSQNLSWAQRSFDGAFVDSAETPVVVASVTTTREDTALTTRIKNVTNTGFLLRAQEEQAADQVHGGEEVSFIAIERGSGQTGDSNFIVAETGRVVDHRSHTIEFNPHFSTRPSLFAEMQTNFGGDAATVRTRNVVRSRTIVFLEEERSGDAEVTHTTESVGYFAIAQGDIFAAGATASVAANITGTAGSLRSTDNSDGDLSSALARQESWGETRYSYAIHSHDHDHNHEDDDQHQHDHAESLHEDSTCSHGEGCGCAACMIGSRSDFGSRNFDFDANRLDQIGRRFFSFSAVENDSQSRSLFRVNADHRDAIRNDLQNFFDEIRQRRVDSFFEQDLGLSGNSIRK